MVTPPDWPVLISFPVNIERGLALLSKPTSVATVSDNAKLMDPVKDNVKTGLLCDK